MHYFNQLITTNQGSKINWPEKRRALEPRDVAYSHFFGHHCVANSDKCHNKDNPKKNQKEQIHFWSTEGSHWWTAVLHNTDLVKEANKNLWDQQVKYKKILKSFLLKNKVDERKNYCQGR